MESLSQSIHQPLEFLIYTSIILIIIVGVFLIKLLIDLSGLVKTVQDFVRVTQAELEPTIKEIQTTLININKVSSNIGDQITNLNNGVQKGAKVVSEAAVFAYEKAKVAGEIIRKNLLSGFYFLINPKK